MLKIKKTKFIKLKFNYLIIKIYIIEILFTFIIIINKSK